MITEFGIANCKPFHTFLLENLKLTSNMGSFDTDIDNYHILVEKILYYTITRLDIQFVTSTISRFMPKPQQYHLEVALHILRYIKFTLDFGILFKYGNLGNLTGYIDAD
jgi:hypothetical protein